MTNRSRHWRSRPMSGKRHDDDNDHDNDDQPSGSSTVVTVSGGFWLIAWLFTVGYAHLSFGHGVLALLIWPYYAGDFAGSH